MKLPWKSLQAKKGVPRTTSFLIFTCNFMSLYLPHSILKNWIFFYFLLCWRKWHCQFSWYHHIRPSSNSPCAKSDFSGIHSRWHSCSYHCLGTFPGGWLFFLFSAPLSLQAQSWQPGVHVVSCFIFPTQPDSSVSSYTLATTLLLLFVYCYSPLRGNQVKGEQLKVL